MMLATGWSLPNRALIVRVAPVGTWAVHAAEFQAIDAPAFSTRDVKVPTVAYGVSRTQSTCSAPLPILKSDTVGRKLAVIAVDVVDDAFAPSVHALDVDHGDDNVSDTSPRRIDTSIMRATPPVMALTGNRSGLVT